MIGDRERIEIALNTEKKTLFVRCLLNLKAEPIDPQKCLPTVNENLVFSDLMYRVQYLPSYKVCDEGRPFQLLGDIFGDRRSIRFADWQDLQEMGKTNDRIQFILDYCDIDEELLNIVKKTTKKWFPLSFNVKKYNRILEEKVKERDGEYPDYSMFLPPGFNQFEAEMRTDWVKTRRQRSKDSVYLGSEMKKNAHN